ncbi:DHHW family protein [Romboutsia sp.]|uniref:DHHW family protein n=1 Tax=Romboutsia sp. TaxID=1965302 RepID=UPI002CAE8F2C|nr:DHHW family protein [Romboutsia sp.]HSQ87289.1 DHHW family protein [Romboutsia sp.]
MNINNNSLLKYMTIIFFFGFIFIIPIVTLSAPDKKISEIENKILTPLPKLNFKDITDKNFMTDFDKYSADQFPLRSDFLKLKNYYNYIVGNRKFRDIYIGKNNRLMEKFTFRQNIIDKNISQATKFSKFLYNKYGIKSTLMVIPTSIAFYDEELPSWAMTDNQKTALNYIKAQIDILSRINYTSTKEVSPTLNFYSPYDILNKYKNIPIYFNTDHHWTQLGARIAYEDMYGSTSSINLLSDSNYKEVSKDFYGTYYSKTLLPQIKGDTIYAYENFNNFKISIDFDKEFDTLYAKDKLKIKNKYQYFLHGDPAFAFIEGNTNSNDEILIFKDSYAHSFIPFLTSDYKKIHVIDPRYYNIDVEDYLSKNKGINRVLFISNIQTFSSADIYKNF